MPIPASMATTASHPLASSPLSAASDPRWRSDGGPPSDTTASMEATLRQVIDLAPIGMLLVDDGGRIELCNRRLAETFGYAEGELLGQPMELLLPSRYRAHHPQHRQAYLQDPAVRAMGGGRDLSGLHRDGSEFPVEIGLSSVLWHGAQMVLATISDISQRKKLETELRNTNAHLEEFTYVASHDLRSPLRGIADLLDWIHEEVAGMESPSVHKNLERAKLRIVRMEQIIDDLLAYARAGRVSTHLTMVDPAVLCASIVELQPVPAGLRVELRVQAAPFPAARVPLETALRNLLGNAVKHHHRPEAGRVEIGAYEDDSFCCFYVSDDGPGIPEAARERVFKLFQTTSASERQGAGIGLAVAKRAVDCHGGRISCEPGPDGAGTTFRILWPRFARREIHD